MSGSRIALAEPSWTDNIVEDEHIIFFKTTDWAGSLLGPLESWSLSLRLYALQLFSDSRPACLYMGPGRVAVYNAAFVPLAGATHPSLMGSRFDDIYPAIASAFSPVFSGANCSKKAVDVVEIPLTVARNCAKEETYFTGTFNPLRGLDGAVEGFYHVCTEVTRQKVADRRSAMFNCMSSLPDGTTSKNVGQHIMNSFVVNALDIPLALLYQFEVESDLRPGILTLRGSVGLSEEHLHFFRHGNISDQDEFFSLLRSARSHQITVPRGDHFDGADWGGHHEPSDYISVIPLASSSKSLGFLVIGLNPRRPLDSDHERLCSELAFNVSSVITAAYSREKQAVSEQQIRYMAKYLSVGLEHLSLDGHVIWANDHYFGLINAESTPDFYCRKLPFTSSIIKDDQSKMHHALEACTTGIRATTIELRMEKLYKPPEGPSVPSTVLLSAFPFVESGQITSIMSCMTDVSRLKWAEAWQARAARDAREAKRRQGEFTDAISHEIRNPLSAIMQLADDISLSLDNVGEKTVGNFDKCIEVIQQNVEHAKTIMVCAVHQRKIVDDVLTISRLDFQSITLSPNSVQPSELVDSAVQMLQADITAANIKLQVNAHMSIHDMDVSWVMCDSLRLTQVLLNLIGNSIKFTKLEKRREITLEYGSSVSLPSNLSSKDIKWVEPKRTYEDVTRNEAWGTGEQIYLTFSISDTGPGMTHEECLHLFRKLQQAGPQTSIKYGGSGLGLYISQALVEKHCGSIGLASEHGKGSTFVIVVKVRRSNPSISTIARLTEDLALEKTDGFHVEKEDANTLHAPKRRVRSVAWHILLVEDNLINQRILQKQLVKAGCLVTVANHGQEALDILRTTNKWRDNPDGNQLDAVLMDIEMPVMDGLTATREIRALESSGDLIGRTEILAVSANARPEQVERAVAAGVDGCVPKPFLIADLLAVIATRIGSREKKGP